MMNIYRRVVLWFKYYNHPCYIGNGEFDHDLQDMQDDQGDGVYSMTYDWVECAYCGATHEDDPEIPEFSEEEYEDSFL